MKRILFALLFLSMIGVYAQESEKYFWEGYKYQSKLKLSKAIDSYFKAVNASEGKSNLNSREIYYLTFAHGEIAKIYSGVSEFSNKPDNVLKAYNSIKKINENYAMLYQRNEDAYIRDFEKVKILNVAIESLKNIYTLKPDLFPLGNKTNNDTNITLGIDLKWVNNYLAVVQKYTPPIGTESYLKENDIILEISTANGIDYFSLIDFNISNVIFGEGSDGDTFRVKFLRNGQVEYTQIKKYLKQIKPTPTKQNEDKTIIVGGTDKTNEDKTITLTVSGTGKNKEEAQKNALRNAIEQAFGTFVSAKSEILNDSLIKDEIISVTNGNIERFELVSEVKLPDSSYSSTLRATISVNKLKSFVESKGVVIEFNGATFAMNMKLQKLNEESELTAIQNLCLIGDKILSSSLNYSLTVKNPILFDQKKGVYQIDLLVNAVTNSNYLSFLNLFWNTIKSISMSEQERESYKEINKSFFEITEVNGTNQVLLRDYQTTKELNFESSFYLRNNESLVTLYKFLKNSNRHLFNVMIVGESKPINCSNFFCKKIKSRGYDANYEDTIINVYCTVLENFINPELAAYSSIDDNYLNSFPNSECVLDYYNPKYEGIRGRIDGMWMTKFAETFTDYLNDINSSKEGLLDPFRGRTYYEDRRTKDNTILLENLRQHFDAYIIHMTTTKEIINYSYKVKRFFTLSELERIKEFKIVQQP